MYGAWPRFGDASLHRAYDITRAPVICNNKSAEISLQIANIHRRERSPPKQYNCESRDCVTNCHYGARPVGTVSRPVGRNLPLGPSSSNEYAVCSLRCSLWLQSVATGCSLVPHITPIHLGVTYSLRIIVESSSPSPSFLLLFYIYIFQSKRKTSPQTLTELTLGG